MCTDLYPDTSLCVKNQVFTINKGKQGLFFMGIDLAVVFELSHFALFFLLFHSSLSPVLSRKTFWLRWGMSTWLIKIDKAGQCLLWGSRKLWVHWLHLWRGSTRSLFSVFLVERLEVRSALIMTLPCLCSVKSDLLELVNVNKSIKESFVLDSILKVFSNP